MAKKLFRTIIPFLLILVILSSCGSTESSESKSSDISSESGESTDIPESSSSASESKSESISLSSEEPEVIIPEVYPDNVGIYIPAEDGTAARKLISEFSSERPVGKDIDCFEIIASQDEYVEGDSFADIWKSHWFGFDDADYSKIGFRIRFTLDNGEYIDKVLLKPGDSDEFFDYIEIYMYDDINQTPGVWYTHLEDEDINEETVISSIKLTAGKYIDSVGDINLTAFIYNDEDNFDKNGDYIGTAKYTITITK